IGGGCDGNQEPAKGLRPLISRASPRLVRPASFGALRAPSDLIAWQKAMDLTETTYRVTRDFPIEERTASRRRCGGRPCRYRRASQKDQVEGPIPSFAIVSRLGTARCGSSRRRRCLRFALGF